MKETKKIPLDIMLSKQLKLDIQQCVYTWIKANSGMSPEQIDYEMLYGTVNFYESESFINPMTYIQAIIETTVSEYFKMPLEEIYYKTRKRITLEKRQVIQYFLYEYKDVTKQSLAVIGSITGGKDHATILHAAKVVSNLYDTEKSFRGMIDELRHRITEKISAIIVQKEAFLKTLDNLNNPQSQLSETF